MFYLYPVEKEFSNFYKNKKFAKRVSFQNIIKVVLIPKYIDICDCKDIWWTEIDKRNAMIFMKNEIELCRITNMKNITKLELEQKEKAIQELRSGIDGVKLNQ